MQPTIPGSDPHGPKYVVMSKGEMIPKLTFYEVQHSSDITTQLMQACKIVAKSPHHGRV